MKIATAQIDIAWQDQSANYAKAYSMAIMAKDAGADVIVFPEMFSTGFSVDTDTVAEHLDGHTPTMLRNLASSLDLAVIGGFVMAGENRRPQNVTLAVDRNGNNLAIYPKIHLIGLLGEDKVFDAGLLPSLFELEGVKTACLVCYDLRFPELFRLIADDCLLVIVVASWPSVRQLHWDILLRARAVENQCFVVGVNRVGKGGEHNFTGGSAIIDPLGRIMTSARDKETLIIADIDPAAASAVRVEMPFLKDRKAHLFEENARLLNQTVKID